MPTFQEGGDYIKLLKTFIKVAEANKGTALGEDDRLLEAEGLCKKFIGHAASALYLFRSTTLPSVKVTDRGISFFDPGSINVLGRAALESFLVFHCVFVEPRSDDEKDFRYYLWLLASYIDRQEFQSRSEEGKKQLNDEKKIIDALKEKMLKRLLTSGFILELFSRMSFKHSVNVISNVVMEVKNQGIKNVSGVQAI